MPKIDYTSIRVTKEVRDSLQKYVEACYSDLSINSMLQVHMENLNEGHVKFPKYGLFVCPESQKDKLRNSIKSKPAPPLPVPNNPRSTLRSKPTF